MAFGVGVIVAATIFVVTGASPELWVDRSAPKAASTRWRLGVSLADTAWLLLGTSLVIGPIRVLRGGRPARHLPARRRISVVAAIFAAAHLVVGLSVHGDLSRPWRSFFSEVPSTGLPIPIRFSFLVLANWIGVATMVGLALLAAISNSASIRRLGARRWKWAQRCAYPIFLLVAVHAVLYQRVEQRWLPHQVAVLVALAVVVFLQVTAAIVVRRRTSPAPLVGRS